MAISKGVTRRSSEKIVLPVDADRTTVVLAQESAPPHITQTLVDCTPSHLDREPATPLLTPTLADSNPVPVGTALSPPQSTQTRAVSKGTALPKARGPPLRIPTQRLTLQGKGLLMAHWFCLLMAHYQCAISSTPLVYLTNGAPRVRH